MEPRQTRMILAAGGVLVAIGAVVWLVKESSTPMADGDAKADAIAQTAAKADASTPADATTMANAEPDATADVDGAAAAPPTATATASASASATTATATASASGGATPRASASASASAVKAAGAEAGAPGPAVSLDEGSAGKTIDLGVGQSVVLMLAASPTSGFDWTVTKAPAALGTPSMGYIAPPGDAMGAPGRRRITWTVKSALPAGDQTVELAYARGFEQGVAPLKTFRFKVRASH